MVSVSALSFFDCGCANAVLPGQSADSAAVSVTLFSGSSSKHESPQHVFGSNLGLLGLVIYAGRVCG